MNTETTQNLILKGLAAAVIALVLTWAMSWSFFDSTRIARWVSAADMAHAAAHVDSSTLAGSLKAGLLQ